MNYARAARKLFETVAPPVPMPGQDTEALVEVTLPIFFLARHAVELALKDILRGIYGLVDGLAEIERHDHKPVTDEPLSEEEVFEKLKTHSLGSLLAMLREVWPECVTPAWQELAEAVDKHEKGIVGFSRYDHTLVRSGQKDAPKQIVHNFKERQVVPIGPLLDRLDAFMQEAAGTDGEFVSALEEVSYMHQELGQAMHSRGFFDKVP